MSGRKLLVVDDDEAVLDYLRAKLGSSYELVCTSTPESVMELARSARPDLILCDLDMPGLDGGDISAQLYGDDDTRAIPLLFLSALLHAQKEVGGRPAISKKAPVSELIARIDALIS